MKTILNNKLLAMLLKLASLIKMRVKISKTLMLCKLLGNRIYKFFKEVSSLYTKSAYSLRELMELLELTYCM